MIAAFIFTGCDSADDDAATHVDRLPVLPAAAESRIGHRDDPDVGFSRVAGMDVDRDGNLYVGEALVPEIRVYSPEGRLLRRIGRRGEGPGEFEGAPRFGVTGDTLWTLEHGGAMEIALFRRDGTLLTTGRTEGVVVPLPNGFGHVLPWIMRPDGQFASHFGRISWSRRMDTSDHPAATDSIPFPAVLFDAAGEVTDTIGWLPKPPPRMWRPPSEEGQRMESVEVGGRRVSVPTPPTRLARWYPVLDGYITVETPEPSEPADAAFTVTRVDLQGDTVFSRDLYYEPRPYTSADLDSIAVRSARGEPGGMTPYAPGRPPPPDWEARANVLRAAMDFPGFQLPIDYVWVGPDESVWIRMNGGEDQTTTPWVVLHPDGRPRGQVELPSNSRILWARDETFWAVEPDELEVPWLVRYGFRSVRGDD